MAALDYVLIFGFCFKVLWEKAGRLYVKALFLNEICKVSLKYAGSYPSHP
jgi:hypothetical protein